MDLRQLRYFQAVAEELSYSHAAERLRIAQPALSRAVQEMEAELGGPLLDRNRRTVSLTPAGRVLLREIAIIFERWDEALRRVKRTAAGEEGELRLGYIGPPTQPFLGRLLHEYRARFPRVSIHLEERTPERVWEMLAKGRLSAALTRPVATTGVSGLRTMLLRKERFGAVVPPEHPLATQKTLPWKALASEPLVVLARREGVSSHDGVLAACRGAGFAPRLAFTPSLIGTVLSYVEAGAGIGIVPESVMAPGLPLRFVPLVPAVTIPLVLVWPEDEDTPAVQRFRDLVVEWQKSARLWTR
ncbi:MAG TPA: LysR substrate-binding domain-containing protein [Chthoniobacteraceae bacterium]|jgi:DNA-binding transcriptional LysR family regulator|nr:LysR substrate-binding domain-containing protein [Chthoniobacteraceae bacterium]